MLPDSLKSIFECWYVCSVVFAVQLLICFALYVSKLLSFVTVRWQGVYCFTGLRSDTARRETFDV